jgi:hypothetical protein
MGSADGAARPSRRPSRCWLVGAFAGALAGLLFALAVISFADCAGPNCTEERVVGVIGHVLGGALIGEAVWVVAYGLWRLVRRAAR